MHIKVKGVNGHLVFVFDDSQEFNSLISVFDTCFFVLIDLFMISPIFFIT